MEHHSQSAELIRAFVDHSPFAVKLGIQLVELAPDRCKLRLPFDESLATYDTVVHGGATAALIDVACTAAAWSSPREQPAGGATVDLTVHYLRPAKGEDLLAEASIARRGREICSVQVAVAADPSRRLVAKALATYKLRAQTTDGG